LTAPARRHDAAMTPVPLRADAARDLWRRAAKIRDEWLGYGLSTQQADRQTAERNLAAIYARLSRPRPQFVWAASPAEAIALVAGWPTLDQLYGWVRDPRPPEKPPLASDLAMMVSRLRGALSAGVSHTDPELSPARKGKHGEPWPDMAPLDALRAGVPLGVVLHQGIHTALHRSLARGFRQPVRDALASAGPIPVCWYGQQDANWIAYYDILHRLGLGRYRPDDLDHLDHWAAVTRSCGWWWPGEDQCVVTDRPEHARAQPVPGTLHEEIRLRPGGLRYRDGWSPLPA
jgi:Domain of unknown function (DUF6745)